MGGTTTAWRIATAIASEAQADNGKPLILRLSEPSRNLADEESPLSEE
jgi:hypothetical protein